MTPSNELSNREQEVLEQLLAGKSNKMIAASLHISVRTVEFHLKNIYAKHQVGSRTELILKLGQSTVVGQEGDAENRDTPDARHWVTSIREAVSRNSEELRMKITVDEDARDGSRPMTFQESIVTCLTSYAEFRGRASRPEFWWFALFVLLVATALTYISEALGSVFLIATLLPFLAAGARRLRDIGYSPWWLLFLLVPVGGIVVLSYFWALPSTDPLLDKTSSV